MKQWNSETLPPVGTVCQWDNGNHDWITVVVLGITGDELWVKPKDGSQSFVVCDADFRPLPDERSKAIDEILQIIDHNGVDPLNSAKQIYDAGCRNYSAKPGFEWRYVCKCCGCKIKPGEELPHGC